MAGGHDSHDTHKKSGGGGGSGKAGFTERLIERFAWPMLIVFLAVGFFFWITDKKNHFMIEIPHFETIFGGHKDDTVIRGCIPPKVAPWPCHDPVR